MRYLVYTSNNAVESREELTISIPISDMAPVKSSRAGTNLPRFQVIVDDIRARITSGDWLAHTPIPSERGMAEQYGVSRMTARRALEALELNGLVYRQDRRGRFVSPQRLSYNVGNMVSFLKDSRSNGTELQIEVVKQSKVPANAALASALTVKKGEPLFQYTRLFLSGGHATFVETESIIARRFPGFLKHNLQQSTTAILETHYNTAATAGDIVIRMRGVNEQEANLLGLSRSQSGIELEQVTTDNKGIPFCFARQLWRGELAEFSARAIVNG